MSKYLTPKMADTSEVRITSAVGTGLSFFVLIVIGGLYTYRGSRIHFDRVSFRLILYSLVANMFFGLFGTISGYFTGPSVSCAPSMFLLQLSLQISSFLPFCIALNLQLVVVHGVRAKHLEKFYVACSMVMALAITIPPFAAGQYGWDPLEKQCWYTNRNRAQRIAWQIGAQLIWTGITVLGEVLAACIVATYMLRVHFRRKRILSPATPAKLSETHRNKRSRAVANRMSLHANTYANVIFRIALYPMVSCVINLTSIGTVIHSTSRDGIQNANDYRILLLSDFLYGGRAIVYALLAATDLALLRAIRAFVAHHMGWDWGSTTTIRSHSATGAYIGASRTRHDDLVVQVELSTVVASDDADGRSRTNASTDGKTRDGAVARESFRFGSPGGEEDQALSPAMDKAERGALAADLDAGRNVGSLPLNPPRSIAFELTSPITPTQRQQRWEEEAREQAEEEEFMRVI